ncbi:electron transport complex subunit RsxC [Motiliproteus coralliicola]|uniref:Ion-translocating oxidoreductase complex subunit C n=1 Tax=Motiliproteus coralliicola TaxID=2283196 RepID=A0A369WCL5_9GAMM|nr:electron transport complex subunit RsxC [Motiliproteus coralliicola]RDE19472.1 electron transport complex subunit RsxC [Motiliproteus coralliicola]
MSRIWSFHGGIHPPENKQQSLLKPLRQAPIPPQLIIPLQQHIGAPATPLVEVGERVLKGQAIAEPSGHVSIYQHAPTSGIVSHIGNYSVPHPSGMEGLCIQIDTDGKDEWIEHQGVEDFRSLEKPALAEMIRCAGISGMGGAGFPTEIKLHLADDHIINTLIVNAVECEPYITADDMLMRERAAQIIGGIEIAAHLIKPTHCLIGIEDNKPEAAIALTQAARASEIEIEVVVVPTKYPSGGEKQLVKLLTGVEVPYGKIPADIGIVVQNVGTMSAVNQAVKQGKPLISRITTLTGDALDSPGNFEVLLGTPVEFLLQQAGLNPMSLNRLVMGGPMMGYTLSDTSVPVVKTSNCVIAATEEEFPQAPPAQNCIRCGQCEQVCPAELLPQQLHWFAKGKEFDKAQSFNLMDCIECGACAYVCPSNIPLVQYYRFAKGEIRREQAEQRKAEQARIRFEARQERQEREKEEKAAKRKARAEAASRSQANRKDQVAAGKPAAADPQEQIKKLKTEAAVARTKLKKAEKALAEDTANTELQAAVEVARSKSEQAQQALEAAEKASPAPAPTLAELKIAAATARTKVTKTEKALADAEAKGAASADKLRASLDGLRAKAEAAQQALEKAEQAEKTGSSSKPAAPAADLKQLKSAASIARTKLKKAQKALDQAREDRADTAELEQQLATAQQKADTTQQAFEAAEKAADQADGGQAAPAADAPDLKALKSAASIARTKLKKTQKVIDQAREDGKDTGALEQQLAKLQQKADDAQKAFEEAEKAEQSSSPAPQPAADKPDLKALKSAASIARTKLKKTQKVVDQAREDGKDTSALEQQLTKLQQKADDAQKAFEAAEQAEAGSNTSQPTDAGSDLKAPDLKQLKSAAAIARTKVKKTEKALADAQAQGSESADSLATALDKLKAKASQAEQALAEAEQNSETVG